LTSLDKTMPLTFGHVALAAIRLCRRLLAKPQSAAAAKQTNAAMTMRRLSLMVRS
jgi:hypothetical protein